MKSGAATVKQAHGGIGSSSHMACLLFATEIGARPTLVAYRGTGPAMNDLIGGHVDFFCEQSVSVAEQAKSGAIKAYAVSAATRLPAARRADREGGRRRLYDEHLGRHFRAEGHAAGRWWPSLPPRSTRRSTTTA